MPRVSSLAIFALALCALLAGCSGGRSSSDHFERAGRLLGKGQYSAARNEINAGIKAHPSDPDAYVTSMALYMASKRYTDACIIGEALIKRDKSGKLHYKLPKLVKADIFSQLGFCYSNIPDIKRAEHSYESALTLDPNNPQYLNGLGWLYADNDIKLQKALELTQCAVELAPKDGSIVDSYGWSQYKLGMYDAAVLTLKRAVELLPDNGELRYHLGAAYAAHGCRNEALVEVRKALLLDHSLTKANKLLKKLQ
ncbi:MAG: tetratricopeptide repeat protein [Armatimonadota bacterium]|nr:tetratricopeptide repeat protein [bacterium]